MTTINVKTSTIQQNVENSVQMKKIKYLHLVFYHRKIRLIIFLIHRLHSTIPTINNFNHISTIQICMHRLILALRQHILLLTRQWHRRQQEQIHFHSQQRQLVDILHLIHFPRLIINILHLRNIVFFLFFIKVKKQIYTYILN